MEVMQTFNILRGNDDKFESTEDKVIREFSLKILVNKQELVTLVCSPISLKELAVGYVYSEGLIKSKSDIINMELTGSGLHLTLEGSISTTVNKFSPIITSSSGKMLDNADIKSLHFNCDDGKIAYGNIYEMAEVLSKGSELFKETGGVHSALITDYDNSFIAFREDIGRHNTVDKIAGFMVLNQVSSKDKMLIISGRASSEMLLKTARSGIPILVSRSAPTDMAIELADKLGITLIGFVRGKRMNIYTHGHRLNI